MNNNDNYLWYASYGSNISTDRFLCYVQGGKPEGATRTYHGCTDKSLPLEQKSIIIPHELYFSQSAKVWNGGGVCFINPEKNEKAETLGNMYLITKEQFMEVVQQENSAVETAEIDFDKARKEKSLVVIENSWYGNLLFLGQEGNAPIFTFTNEDYLHQKINAPDQAYLKTIIKGLKASHQLDDTQLREYFLSKKGINKEVLESILNTL